MPTVLFEQNDGIATVTLNRPERLNAISWDLVKELHAALTTAMRSSDVRVVILTGAGNRAFCAGDDLVEVRDLTVEQVRDQILMIQDITRLIVFEPKLVVAAVNGWAVGGGFEWVVDCDFSIWADTARAFLPEVSLGMGVTGGVISLLPRVVGWHRAKALFFLNEKHSAETMLAMGVAHKVVPPEQLMAEARQLATRLRDQPQAALAGLKRAIAQVHRDEIERAMAAETETLMTALAADPAERARIAEFAARKA